MPYRARRNKADIIGAHRRLTPYTYTTIAPEEHPEDCAPSAIYEIQRSRFLSYVIHAEDETTARTWVQSIQKKHFDARHVPYAWVLGASAHLQRSSDDGEPGGTAGSPILETIKAHGITDAAVAVVRYFGGIKLGAGGLVRAYAHAAHIGIEAAKKVCMTLLHTMYVHVDYDLLALLERYVRDTNLCMGETVYAEDVMFTLFIPTRDIEIHQQGITNITSGRAVFALGDRNYIAAPMS